MLIRYNYAKFEIVFSIHAVYISQNQDGLFQFQDFHGKSSHRKAEFCQNIKESFKCHIYQSFN